MGLRIALAALFIFINATPLRSQLSHPGFEPAAPPVTRPIGPPPATATAEELETRGDQLRQGKLFLSALDYYHAALSKEPKDSGLYNKAGITELLLGNYREAKADFEKAVKLDHGLADAHNNLGVVYYEWKNCGKAIKEYRKAIKIAPKSSVYYVNLGAAYFYKKKWKEAAVAYSTAVQLDPNILQSTSIAGTSAQMSAPEDRAHFEYLLAKIYAKNGMPNRALLCLRRAQEGGYKQMNDVYKDPEFAALRKDPRFKDLMAQHPFSIPE